MKRVIILQARMGSTRLPGKVLLPVLGRPLLSYQIERLKRCHLVDEIVVATTVDPKDDAIVALCKDEGVAFFRGSEEDVLSRYVAAAKEFKADLVVRLTGDCPLIDPSIVDLVIETLMNSRVRYVSSGLDRTFPRGMDAEAFYRQDLEVIDREAKLPYEREHVTPFFYQHPDRFALFSLKRSKDASMHRWTVDTPEDFTLVSKLLEALYPKNCAFTLEDLLNEISLHPEWSLINAHIQQKTL